MIAKILALLAALAAIADKVLGFLEATKREREKIDEDAKEREREEQINDLHRDPAGWFSGHFGGGDDGVLPPVSDVSGDSPDSPQANPPSDSP